MKTNHTNLVNLRCMRKQEPPSLGTATLKVGEFFFGFDPVEGVRLKLALCVFVPDP